MAPIGSTNLNDGATRIGQEYPSILRRSQRIASSSQTPLRQEIRVRNSRSSSSSPTRTRQSKPIQPQVVYHQQHQPARASAQPNYYGQMREDTPVIRNQRLLSEDEDNVFQSSRIAQTSAAHVADNTVQRHASHITNAMLLETPGRIRTLIDRFTPSALSKRILSNSLPPEPSSPLLSIPTVRANKVRFDDSLVEGEQPENSKLIRAVLALIFIPFKFAWNNIQTMWNLVYYLSVYLFLWPAQKLFVVFLLEF